MSASLPDWLAEALGVPAAPGRRFARCCGKARLGEGGWPFGLYDHQPRRLPQAGTRPVLYRLRRRCSCTSAGMDRPPPGAMELALVVEDLNAKKGARNCTGWCGGLPRKKGKLMEGEKRPRTGKNARAIRNGFCPIRLWGRGTITPFSCSYRISAHNYAGRIL